jgi:hypothetical protein
MTIASARLSVMQLPSGSVDGRLINPNSTDYLLQTTAVYSFRRGQS